MSSVGKFSLISLLSVVLMACSSTQQKGSQNRGDYQETGQASYYAMKYQGRQTANGEYFDQGRNTAAHKTLPFDTKVKVTNINNGRSVVVRINDRGPFVRGRIIDLSKSAFNSIGNTRLGLLNVTVETVN